MAGEWKDKKLGQVLSFSNGRSSPERADGLPYPVYGSNGIIGYASETNSGPNTIVIGRVGSYCGSLYFSKQKCWVTDNAIRAVALNENSPLYLYYLLWTLQLNRWRGGSGQPLLNQSTLNVIPAMIPALEEQQAIAHILGTLDDKIELNRRMNLTLEAMARAIFKSWFVDFDPVRAKATGRDPGLPKKIANLFPDSFQELELSEIPEGWRVQSLVEDIDVIGGGTPKTSVPEYWDGQIPWFSVVDTPRPGEIFVIQTEKSITEAGRQNSSTKILPVGTTIISARGTVGNLALVGVPMAMNQSCYGLRDRGNRFGYFVYFTTAGAVETLRQRTHGSVFNTITRDTLQSVRVVAPLVNAVAGFERYIDAMLQRILSNLCESRTLASLRDTLLPKLISGEVPVPDAERIVGRAL